MTRQHNYGTWRFQKNWNPMHIVDAEGCYIIDGSGEALPGLFVAAHVLKSWS